MTSRSSIRIAMMRKRRNSHKKWKSERRKGRRKKTKSWKTKKRRRRTPRGGLVASVMVPPELRGIAL